MRLFASAKSASVNGLVLVESMHHRQFQVLGPAFPASSPSDAPALVQMRDFWTGGWRAANSTPEHIDFERSFAQDQAVTSLGNLPLFTVSAASSLNAPFIQDASARQRMQHLWNELQTELSHLSDNRHSLSGEERPFRTGGMIPTALLWPLKHCSQGRHA